LKTRLASTLIALTAVISSPAIAASEHGSHTGMQGDMHTAAPAAAAMVDGLVKKIDKSTGKVTLAHGPLTNLNMPAMTMVFRVKEAAWLDQIKVADKIRFVADSINGVLTIVRFETEK